MPASWRRQFGDARYWLQKLPTEKWVIVDRRYHLYGSGVYPYPFAYGFRVFDTFDDVLRYLNPAPEMCLYHPCSYIDGSGCTWTGLCVLDKGHEEDHSPVHPQSSVRT